MRNKKAVITLFLLISSILVYSLSARNLGFLLAKSKPFAAHIEAQVRSHLPHKLEGFVNIIPSSVNIGSSAFSLYGVFNDLSQGVQYEFDSSAQKTIMYTKTNTNHDKVVAVELPSLPIVSHLRQALLDATPLSHNDKEPILDDLVSSCIDQGLPTWHTHFLGKDYVVCLSLNVNKLQVIGKDMIATITLYDDLNAVQVLPQFKQLTQLLTVKNQVVAQVPLPRDVQLKSMNFTVAAANSSKKHQSVAVAWFKHYDSACQLHWRRGKHCKKVEEDRLATAAASVSIPAPQRICIFLHGAGNEITGDPVNNTWTDYWGASLPQYTPQCSERWYIREDTVHFGWDDHRLQHRYCQLALKGQTTVPGKVPLIKNKVIFSHSMANLILAAAIKNGYCDFDNETSSWYSIQAPYMGSPAASYLRTLCRNASFYEYLLYYGATFLHLCNATTMTENRVYQTLEANFCSQDGLCVKELERMAQARIKGSMCGDSAMGLFSSWSVTFYMLSTIIGFKEYNDGLVGISSCRLDWKYDSNPYGNYYLTGINHRDGTCYNGNGWLSQGSPCDFYVNKY